MYTLFTIMARLCAKKSFLLILGFALFLCLFAHVPIFADEERTTINIENAQQSRYEKDKETGNDSIILTGNVKLSVSRGSNNNIITADEVRYDRKADMIYASGNVQLEQTTSNSGGQNVSANALMFNTATLEGVFDNGRVVQVKSDAINLPSGSTLIVASDIFGRSESNTIAFKNGVLTFCDDEDPHWKIRASRIWLLPGGEFAFLNALLFVGPVPVVWLPAFYYPKDELIFNPVFGNDPRRGYFIQTTAYVLGHKPLNTETTSSDSTDSDAAEKIKALFNFIKPSSLKEQKIEGLMLHNLDADYKGNTSNYIKIMGDYYANLGFMIGVDGVIAPPKYISTLNFSTRIGVSNTVYRTANGEYTPFGPSGEKVWDKSSLMGLSLPFRYQASLNLGISSPFSLSLSVPLYSDPYFQSDFMDERQESMDWISYLLSNASQDTSKEEKTVSETSSFTWTLNSSYTIPLPQIVKPYLNGINISLSSSLAFSTMSTDADGYDDSRVDSEDLQQWKARTPERKFYYPSQVTPANLSIGITGTIFDLSLMREKTFKGKTPAFPVALTAPDSFLTEKELEERNKKKAEEAAEKARKEKIAELEKNNKTVPPELLAPPKAEEKNEEEKKEEPLFASSDPLPPLEGAASTVQTIPGFDFKSTYSVKPTLTTQLAYSSDTLKESSDFDWNVMRSSMYTLKVPVTIDNVLSYAGTFFTINSSFMYDPVWQEHPYINNETDENGRPTEGGYTDEGKFSLQKTDYSAQKQDLTNNNSVSFKPFAYIPLLKDSGITWRTTIKIVRTEFLSDEYKTKDDSPKWEYHTAYWEDEDAITTNDLDFTLAFSEMDGKFTQSHTFTATLAPQAEAYYSKLNFTFPYTTLALSTGIKKSSTEDDAEWIRQPFNETFSFSFFDNKLRFNQSYTYNLDEYYHDSLKFALSWTALTAQFTMQYSNLYDFDSEKGWTTKGDDKEFQPYNFTLSYSPSTWYFYTWKNRISLGLGLSTSISADLVRPTNTSFTFSPSISFKIHEILTFTFTSTSRNDVIYRYFASDDKLAGEKNLFIDLFNSFRFDDDEKRAASGFKLQSLQFDVTHELHDWDLKFTFKVSPRLVNKEYQMNPYISLSVVWRPMAAMKAEIIHDDEDNEWKLK